MIIDTGKRTIRSQALKQLLAILTLVVVILIAMIRPLRLWINEKLMPTWVLCTLIILIYLGYRLYYRVRKVSYIYVSDTDLAGILRIRHFPIKPFSEKQYSIEIPINEFYRYDFKKSKLGIRQEIVLWQIRGKQIFKYPPVSITILRRAERGRLIEMLNSYRMKE